MTPQEAHDAIKIKQIEMKGNAVRVASFFEGLAVAKKALEKQMPKKTKAFNGQCSCPNCNRLFGSYTQLRTLIHWEMPYCKFCGQALDWSDTE